MDADFAAWRADYDRLRTKPSIWSDDELIAIWAAATKPETAAEMNDRYAEKQPKTPPD